VRGGWGGGGCIDVALLPPSSTHTANGVKPLHGCWTAGKGCPISRMLNVKLNYVFGVTPAIDHPVFQHTPGGSSGLHTLSARIFRLASHPVTLSSLRSCWSALTRRGTGRYDGGLV
jgi:hypothetical protein